MSHLKEPLILSFTTNTPGTAYELIYPCVTTVTFNTDFAGSEAYLLGSAPTSNVVYTVKNEITTNTIGTITITASTGVITFDTTGGTLDVDVGDVISIKAAAGFSMGAFGLSLVGER